MHAAVIVERVETWWEAIPLSRPYRIAGHATEAVEMGFVRVVSADGSVGFGCAAPVEEITGESFAACRAALERMRTLGGDIPKMRAILEDGFIEQPAARAALDMALHDVTARSGGVALVDMLGPAQRPLATSVTIGILPLAETLADAAEYVARGFTILKVKIGEDLAQDVERLARLRERFGSRIALRADANVGYDPAGVERFFALTERLDIEFLEQPCPRALDEEVRRLGPALRRRLAADESLFHVRDAERLALEPRPFGIWNIKLVKCGGVTPALAIAEVAERNGIELMWGCMDESVVGIAAALHAAYASRATRYLDLDGSFDLARDPFRGGFELRDGVMHTLNAPGLGVERIE
jgi:L-alanine-DL-glutamate epimerase-like enolase superfamily enzyme